MHAAVGLQLSEMRPGKEVHKYTAFCARRDLPQPTELGACHRNDCEVALLVCKIKNLLELIAILILLMVSVSVYNM